jgi:tRNA (uracil-5-)-methyltransferase
MLDYATQLQFKQQVVERAYDMYTGSLPSGSIPLIGPTIPSPKRYGYRTKITPHFDVPSAKRAAGWEVTIGFGERGRATRILDIEVEFLSIISSISLTRSLSSPKECPIASPVLNQALPQARKEVTECVNHTYLPSSIAHATPPGNSPHTKEARHSSCATRG